MAGVAPGSSSGPESRGGIDRDDNVYKAKLCEQVEKYDEMVDCMKKIANLQIELTVEERNLLSASYKNISEPRRRQYKAVLQMLQVEEAKSVDEININDLNAMKLFKHEIKKELRTICNDVLHLLDHQLIPMSTNVENKIFFYKMKGDYNRYLAEITVDDERLTIAENALVAYKAGSEICKAELPPTHPVRLGLELNYSVFYYEILNSTERACKLAKTAFDDAIADLEALSDEAYKDSIAIMQQLRDNMTLWTSPIIENAKSTKVEAGASAAASAAAVAVPVPATTTSVPPEPPAIDQIKVVKKSEPEPEPITPTTKEIVAEEKDNKNEQKTEKTPNVENEKPEKPDNNNVKSKDT